MDKKIAADLFRYGGLTGFKGFLKGWFIPGFRYTYLLRKSAIYKKRSFRGLFYRILLNHYSYKYGFQIYPTTQISEGFFIGHFGNIVINKHAIIGKNCNIAHGVTLGQTNRGKNQGCPVLGDNVWIGTNAVIVGKVAIGSNVLISPNSFVNFDVPNDSIVIGNPAKILPRANATEGYINFILS